MNDHLPSFPVTVVGSWPRPDWLRDAIRKKSPDLEDLKNQAVQRAMKFQEDAGIDIVSDGEQRRDNFYSFIAEKIDGIELLSLATLLEYVEDKSAFEDLLNALDVPAFAIKNPVAVRKLSRAKPLVVDDYLFARRQTKKKIKVTLPGPYLLSRSIWVKNLSEAAYPDRESLVQDIILILREELLELAEHGVEVVQFDEPALSELAFAGKSSTRTFMCAALAANADPHDELELAIRLINEIVQGIDLSKILVHVCRGNWSQNEDVLLSGPYDGLIPYLNRMAVDGFVLEFATPRSGSVATMSALDSKKDIGFGAVNPRTVEIESPATIVTAVKALMGHIDPRRITLNPDCGFGTFADRPVSDDTVAFQKLCALVAAAKLLRV
jgi:5-methyltetrahydropteroyltriglutamate--homocysteine methyltransferase